MKKFLRFVTLLASLSVFSSITYAQEIRAYALASGSYLFNNKFFTIGGDKFQSKYANGGKFIFGGEYTPWKLVGLEGVYGVGRNNIEVTNLNVTPPQTIGYGIRLQRFGAGLVLHSPIKVFSVAPYATAGLEIAHFGPTSDAKRLAFTQGFADQTVVLESTNKVGFNIGGGVEWDFMHLVGLRVDVRNHTTGTPRYGLPQVSPTGGPIYPVSGAANNLEISAGLVLHIKP